MSPEDGPTVSETGENALLTLIARELDAAPPGEVWAGDDAAVIDVGEETALFTTDMLVEDVDFDLGYNSAADIAWKALAANVSDIAAMGGRPTHAVTSLALREELPTEWVEGFLGGLKDAAGEWGVGLAGGDLSGGSQVVVSIALLGRPFSAPVLRSTSSAGEALCVTGRLGGAAGGLVVLKEGLRGAAEGHERLALRQARPRPRVDAAEVLTDAGLGAMIDLSDGLAVDLWRLCDASGVGCDVEVGAIPVDEDLLGLFDESRAFEMALLGGEDFELLFTISPARYDDASRALEGLGLAATRIGSVTEGDRIVGDGSLDEWRRRGWEHLRSR